ncbi:hypothetical protein AN401_18020 [Zobellella denitrificans]|uniref:Uncharacterized protein n=1 Tax=Zobellella denitrificans TaxID=347534 RepID=A0A291HTT9_9GAMM|nr:hypothetical protein AN401_18020 [Zobellella denitrificans]
MVATSRSEAPFIDTPTVSRRFENSAVIFNGRCDQSIKQFDCRVITIHQFLATAGSFSVSGDISKLFPRRNSLIRDAALTSKLIEPIHRAHFLERSNSIQRSAAKIVVPFPSLDVLYQRAQTCQFFTTTTTIFQQDI